MVEKLEYRAPFDFETLLAYYKSHQILGVEEIDETSYSRVFRTGRSLVRVKVTHLLKATQLQVELDSTAELPQKSLNEIKARVSKMFDLALDPQTIQKSFGRSPHLKALYKKYPGIRIPTSWDPFEAMITTVLGQLVSMEQAGRLVNQLVVTYGEKVKNPVSGDSVYLFPTAKVLAEAGLEEVRTTGARRKTILNLARAVTSGEIKLDLDQDPVSFKAKLLDQPGIGPWSAEYITLRALGNPDSFPGTDLILKRALEAFPELSLDDVKPFRSYAALYLWREHAKTLSKVKSKASAKSPKAKS